MAELRQGAYGQYYGSRFNESESLSQSEMETNVKYIYSYLSAHGWTKNSVSALCGNMEAESTINSGRWQSDDIGNYELGYGLVQWTPVTKYTNWCTEQGFNDPSEMDNNLTRILYEVENKIQWYASSPFYDFTFEEFSKSTEDVTFLAKSFLLNYERPADQSVSVQEYRASLAESWFSFLSGETPSEPVDPDKPKRKGMTKLLLYSTTLDYF